MRWFILILGMTIVVNTASAVTFDLKDGNTIDGKITLSNETILVIEDEEGSNRIIPISSLKDPSQFKKRGSFKDFSLFLNIGSTYLISGKLYDFLYNSLKPTPELSCTSLGIGIDWYFLKFLGVSLECDYYGIFASSSQVSSSLSIGTGATGKVMLIGRIPFKPFIDRDDRFMGLALRLFAGPTYSTFDYSSSFKSLTEKAYKSAGYTVTWYAAPATGIGVIGGVGVLFEYNHLGCGVDIFGQDKILQYPGASAAFDWFEIGTAFRISFDF